METPWVNDSEMEAIRDAECAVIGSCILSYTVLRRMVARLEPSAFWFSANRRIFEALTDLVLAGSGADWLSLKAEIGKDLPLVGGPDYIIQIAEAVPSAVNADWYADQVEKFAAYRVLERNVAAFVKRLKDRESVGELLASVGDLVKGVRSRERFAKRFDEVMDDQERAQGDPGVETGWSSLDVTIGTRGYPLGQMTLVAANTGAGKTAFMTDSATMLFAEHGRRVAYATFADRGERGLHSLVMRQRTGWSKRPDRSETEQRRWDAEREFLKESAANLVVYDASQRKDSTVESFLAWVSDEHDRVPFDAVFVDYVQVLTSHDRAATDRVRLTEVVAAKLDQWVHEAGCAMIAGTQVTDTKAEGRGVRYSKDLKNHCGWYLDILGERSDANHPVEVKVDKSRFGGTGKVVNLFWRGDLSRFVERLGAA